MKIHHKTFAKILNSKSNYLNYFYFSYFSFNDSATSSSSGSKGKQKKPDTLYSEKALLNLICQIRRNYKPDNKRSLKILAQNIKNPKLTKQFSSLRELAQFFRGDRQTIRYYLNQQKTGYYRKVWVFTYI